ncbi:MAG TPA: zf-HC2 domain-containing protein [Trebonia sp.]|nr:zf-HC2 domain-containing protein [Trebonia sp.]
MTAISSEHTDVGAYALGLLEDQDRAAFESHLATCDACRAELETLSPVSVLLRGMEPVHVPGDASPPVDLLHRRAEVSRRRRSTLLIVSAAACVALLGGGIAVGLASAPNQTQAALTGQVHSATNPATGATGIVGLVAKGWGTQVQLDLAGVTGPQECELIAVSKTGARKTVTGWLVPAPGEGVPGHPAHLLIEGGTAIALRDLARFEVIVVNGPVLLTIPV